MFINLKPCEEERVFRTLPPGRTMSFIQTDTPLETLYEFHYEITPPVIETNPVDTSDKEDCEVVDYFPHRTPNTNPRNKQQVDVIDGYMKQLSKAHEQQSLLDTPHVDDGIVPPDTSKSTDILSNNTQLHRDASIGDTSALYPQTSSTNINTYNVEPWDVTCNNDVRELNVTCSNVVIDNDEKNVTCTNNANDIDMISNKVNHLEIGNNVNYINNFMTCNTEESNAHLGLGNGMIRNNVDVSSLCGPTNCTSSVNCQPTETNNTNDAERYKVITSDISDYESDNSGTSSVSHTSAVSSEGYTVPVLVRVTKEIHDCMTNKECVILLPKLTNQTIEYWNKTASVEDSVNTNPTHSGSSTPLLPTDYSPWEDTSDDSAKCNNNLNKDVTNSISKPVEKASTNVANISTSEFEGFTENDLPYNVIHGNTSVIKTAAIKSEHYSSDNSRASDLLIIPRASARSKKRKVPLANYKDMCANSQSDSDNASFTEVRRKPVKPIPGMVPSLSRITVQTLIKKHRASKRPKNDYHEYSTDTNPNITGDEYDGDTEEYDTPDIKQTTSNDEKPVPSPMSMTIKTESIPKSDTPKKRTKKIKTTPKANSKRQ